MVHEIIKIMLTYATSSTIFDALVPHFVEVNMYSLFNRWVYLEQILIYYNDQPMRQDKGQE